MYGYPDPLCALVGVNGEQKIDLLKNIICPQIERDR